LTNIKDIKLEEKPEPKVKENITTDTYIHTLTKIIIRGAYEIYQPGLSISKFVIEQVKEDQIDDEICDKIIKCSDGSQTEDYYIHHIDPKIKEFAALSLLESIDMQSHNVMNLVVMYKIHQINQFATDIIKDASLFNEKAKYLRHLMTEKIQLQKFIQ
jgi:hypothetical protein